ncbi:MAG: DUF1844 domain-containing protein [Pirellulaceae bacterium]
MSDQGEQKPKLVVDEDWKAQVEAERETLREQEQKQEAAAAEAPASPTDAASSPDASRPAAQEPGESQLPPASFPLLVSSMATQAAMALGQLAIPGEDKPVVRPELARHYIDLLGVLEEKTKGNLTPEESKMLEGVLHELRMLFLQVRNQPSS